jgi:hypothetical protein
MVAEPVPVVVELPTKETGIESEPVSVPSESVIVKGALTVLPPPPKLPKLSDPSKLPFPMLVNSAVPEAESPAVVTVVIALTVSVVFVVAACAAAAINNPITRFLRVRSMCAFRFLRSSIVRGNPDEGGSFVH